MYNGEIHTVTEWLSAANGTDVVLTSAKSIVRMSVVTLCEGVRARPIPTNDGPNSTDDIDPASVVLASLTKAQAREIQRRCEHIREMITGYRSGSAEVALPDEPRPQYRMTEPLLRRYAAKAEELTMSVRHVRRIAKDYQLHDEAGLASARWQGSGRADPRWVETALQIMVEHTNESKPSRKAIILQTAKRLELWFGPGAIELPSRATAYRVLEWLDKQHRTFGGTTKRNRDIAARPRQALRQAETDTAG